MTNKPTPPRPHQIVGLLLAWLTVGCQSLASPGGTLPPTIPSPAVTLTPVPSPEARYGRIAWLDDGLVVHVRPTSGGSATSGGLWRFPLDGSAPTQLTLPLQAGCESQGVLAPARLPDGRLGYIVTCFPRADPFRSELRMLAGACLSAYHSRAARGDRRVSP